MQNRNMFLYRRQGPKKRPKSGTPRKGRNPQKGLPNSARELLPIIQPATKALAQMLAGRTAASGQLGHARAVLAHTERLVAERAHNRLNPAEREEFFEQVARLKLTLSDAESEAEFQAAEEQAPASVPVPVDRERLKAMALSLTMTSDRSKSYGSSSPDDGADSQSKEDPGTSTAATGDGTSADGESSESLKPGDRAAADAGGEPAAAKPSPPSKPIRSGDTLTLQPGTTVSIDGTKRRRKPKLDGTPSGKAASRSVAKRSTKMSDDVAADVAEVKEKSSSSKASNNQKLPKGWIIDEEGFVVPGTG